MVPSLFFFLIGHVLLGAGDYPFVSSFGIPVLHPTTTATNTRSSWAQQISVPPTQALYFSSSSDDDDVSSSSELPLCDLQTLLKLAGCLDTGGSAKVAIQSGECQLNGVVETKRAKKLFPGDIVTFNNVEYPVEDLVQAKNYVYKPKVKKIKPPKEDNDNEEPGFTGQYRSKEWREERKQKKIEKKQVNSTKKIQKRRRNAAQTVKEEMNTANVLQAHLKNIDKSRDNSPEE